MIKKRGGVDGLAAVFQMMVTWADFCFATVWNCQPVFPRLHQAPGKRLEMDRVPDSKALKPSDLIGSESPIILVFEDLRRLSFNLDPEHIAAANRLEASTTIYNLEYTILLLKEVQESDPGPTECVSFFEAVPLKTATHIFIWLVIRELPPYSELLYTATQRLKDSLEVLLPG